MKVRFNEPMAGSQIVYNTEDVYDIDVEFAKRLIAKNICYAIEVEKPVVKKPSAKKAKK
jgi:hypothetical protein